MAELGVDRQVTAGEGLGDLRGERRRPERDLVAGYHRHREVQVASRSQAPLRRAAWKVAASHSGSAPQGDGAVGQQREPALDVFPEGIGVQLVERWLRRVVGDRRLEGVEVGRAARPRRPSDWARRRRASPRAAARSARTARGSEHSGPPGGGLDQDGATQRVADAVDGRRGNEIAVEHGHAVVAEALPVEVDGLGGERHAVAR